MIEAEEVENLDLRGLVSHRERSRIRQCQSTYWSLVMGIRNVMLLSGHNNNPRLNQTEYP
jgi:hypothetical protein